VRLELVAAEGPGTAGFVRLRFRMLVDGVERGEARATVRGRVRGPAVVATRTLPRGTPLDESDLALRESDLTRLAAPPLRDLGEVEGRVPERTLGAGRVLTGELLAPAPVVRRGEAVELRIEGRGMTLRAVGRALGTAAPGQLLAAENGASGARVEGVVQSDGSLRVLRKIAEPRD
jgi:flagella basal body P-ring formation protein FlgA